MVVKGYCDYECSKDYVIGQGELQGALAGMRAIAEGMGPLVAGNLLSWAEHQPRILRGSPYLVLALFCLLAFALSYSESISSVTTSRKYVMARAPPPPPPSAHDIVVLLAPDTPTSVKCR